MPEPEIILTVADSTGPAVGRHAATFRLCSGVGIAEADVWRADGATVVPKSVPMDAAYGAATGGAAAAALMQDGAATGPARHDAMSALVCSDLVVSGILLSSYVESVETGEAARHFAARLHDSGGTDQVDEFFACFKKPSTDKPRATP